RHQPKAPRPPQSRGRLRVNHKIRLTRTIAMMKISKKLRAISLGFAAAGILLVCGSLVNVDAQRDPFAKPGYQKAKTPGGPVSASPGKGTSKTGVPAVPVNYGPPGIEARIDYYKRLRETAAASGAPLPKVTS